MAAANTDKFKKVAVKFSTTVAAPGVAAADSTTAPLASASGLPTDTACNLTFNRVNSEGTVQATYETATGVVSGSNFTNMVRGVEGTASAWPAGTVVECLVTADAQNDMVDGILAQHTQAGEHGAITTTGITSTGDATFSDGKGIIGKTTGGTSKTILALDTDVTYVGNAAQATVYRGTTHTVWDANGNEVIKTAAGTVSAVNEVTITNAASTGTPSIAASGETNVNLAVIGKGTGKTKISVLRQDNTTNAVNHNTIVLTGIGVITNASYKDVTFGVTFAAVPVIIVSKAGGNGSSGSYAYPSSTAFADRELDCQNQAVTGFRAVLDGVAPNASQSALFTWIAIGELA